MVNKLLILFFILLGNYAWADDQVVIAKQNRVFNQSGDRCVYASLETLGRHLGKTRLYGITLDSNNPSTMNEYQIVAWLNGRGIRCEIIMPGDPKPVAIVEQACKEGRGVAVGISGKHVIVLTHFDTAKQIVHFIDNIDPDLKTVSWTMEEFMKKWDGLTIALVK